MSLPEPFIWIGIHKVKEGKTEALKSGTPSPAVLEMVEQVRQAADQRETLTAIPHPLAGFTRLGASAST